MLKAGRASLLVAPSLVSLAAFPVHFLAIQHGAWVSWDTSFKGDSSVLVRIPRLDSVLCLSSPSSCVDPKFCLSESTGQSGI